MPRLTVLLTALVLAVLLLPAAASARGCSIGGDSRKLGPTYTTRIVATNVSCTSAKRLVRSFYNCRKAAGGVKGTCRKRVSGYKCTEVRRNKIATQFDSTVTCRTGSRKVVHDYTQFT